MFVRAVAALSLLSFMAGSPAFADTSDCDSVLVTSSYQNLGAYHGDSRLAEFVSADTWDRLRGWTGGDGPIYGVRAGTNYLDYHMRAVLLARTPLGFSQARSIFWSGLEPDSRSYRDCLDQSLAVKPGLSAGVREGTASSVTIEVHYQPAYPLESQRINWAFVPASSRGPAEEVDSETIFPGTTVLRLQRKHGYDVVLYREKEILRVPDLLPPASGLAENPHRLYCDFPLDLRIPLGERQRFVCHNMKAGATLVAETSGMAETIGEDHSVARLEVGLADGFGRASNRISGRPSLWRRRTRSVVPDDGTVEISVACEPARPYEDEPRGCHIFSDTIGQVVACEPLARGCRLLTDMKAPGSPAQAWGEIQTVRRQSMLRVCAYDPADAGSQDLCGDVLDTIPVGPALPYGTSLHYWPHERHYFPGPRWTMSSYGRWICDPGANDCSWEVAGRAER